MRFLRPLFILPLIASLLAPLAVRAVSPSVVISEIQTGDTASLSNEFVEFYNPTTAGVDLAGWILEYKSATGTSWSKKATLAGSIASDGFYLAAPSAYLPAADASFSAGLSGTAGQMRIKDKSGTVIDTVGWGSTANAAETSPAAAPAAGQSLERLPGRLNETGGNATDTDDNSKDFVIRTTPLPQSTKSALEIPGVITPDPVEDTSTDEAGPVQVQYLPVMITEVLPDPASPALDSKDEFIELYNPNSVDLDLAGYTLRGGSNFHDYYNLPSKIITAGGYATVYASESHISLTNIGGAAQILDPTGTLVSQTDNYPKAITGASWDLIEGGWAWSLQLTPGADNVLVEPPVAIAGAVNLPAASKAKTPKVSTTAPKSSKAASSNAPKATKASTKTVAAKLAAPLAAAASSPTSRWLLLGLVALTLTYVIYEYRYDLQNYYILGRRKLNAWNQDWRWPTWRRGN